MSVFARLHLYTVAVMTGLLLTGPGSASAAMVCSPDRPAYMYQAASGKHSVPLPAPLSGKAPATCINYTGIGSTEPGIVVASDNTLIFAPAFTNDGIGVLRSKTMGQSWDMLYPDIVYLSAPSPISTPVPILRDFRMYTPKEQAMYRSMDGGETWNYVSNINLD